MEEKNTQQLLEEINELKVKHEQTQKEFELSKEKFTAFLNSLNKSEESENKNSGINALKKIRNSSAWKINKKIEYVQKDETKKTSKPEEEFYKIYLDVLRSAKDAIYIKDSSLRYKYVNPAMEKFFNLTAGSILNKNDIEVYGWEDGNQFIYEDMQVLHGKNIEYELTKQVGQKIKTFHVYKLPLKNSEDKITGVVSFIRNITILKEREDQLSGMNKNKDKFFQILAHDLRSPFLSILGFAEVLADELNDLSDEEIKICAKNIYKSANGVYRLLENLLEWSRLRTGRIELNFEKFAMNDLINNILDLYTGNSGSKDIKISFENVQRVEVFADKNMCDTVLRNILGNAIKFTNRGGRIFVELVKLGGFAEIKITDNGRGMSPSELDKLFKIEEKFKTRGTEDENGTGLGLLLCKEFVEKNNGSIEVNSILGEGTSVLIKLPVTT